MRRLVTALVASLLVGTAIAGVAHASPGDRPVTHSRGGFEWPSPIKV
jgi:hypothetical protein